MNSTAEEEHLIIPVDKISPQAFEGLVEEFILREGTDYGHSDPTLEQKKQRVFNQIQAGHVQVVYSTVTQDTTLMTRSQMQKLRISTS